ncbi:AraC family transcriptional regulator ligand-binding domain-containing protein [Pseudoteredinibacter isoporae]|uniref:HTH-type transcriptional regulator AraC-type N-terminal domain-containing protein n=1 Tax=Pseudoteredinibacter isoporae TaxID=570281 RepID=A0A7X0MV33_9GAMM|nr:AraC family transcriptional regulator ligand-binding domain-containing protein [Pseudoteredinibacter isoporae]MBB6521311.1 hypothetical protein [Pseudoteredinibacter isoporae]NHO86867.1 AraC family transcriptional regulator [Pseudoteredinibacter isoporae]NIB24681.1 AraC family transcriptional regulator [Pseudoteredinibacter isoporae]
MDHRVRIGYLSKYPEAVANLGGDPKSLSQRCNILFETFEDEDNTILYSQVIDLMELTAYHLRKPDFGLYLGSLQKIDALGPISVALKRSESVNQAIQCIAQLIHIQSPAIHIHVDENDPDCVKIIIDIITSDLSHQDMLQNVGLTLTSCQEILRQLIGAQFKLLKIEIPHDLMFSSTKYSDYFDSDIEFNSESMAWHIPKDMFNLPLSLS